MTVMLHSIENVTNDIRTKTSSLHGLPRSADTFLLMILVADRAVIRSWLLFASPTHS